ncbi:hypothetical protein [Oceanibacterium hippocampi]|uniref:Lipoprotein n=1 Tax=Oceanibacterium hippocampi TaxID=745714 RepID=A0A1Y5T708_9PROT|nr:hypothetical protein [Oceanibacterium hippocampi]SLN57368.1 hypothetical protein OCH7691_02507 [Oceanibacterium hippocampi]
MTISARLILAALAVSLLAACTATPPGEPTRMLANFCQRYGFGPEGSANWIYCLRTYSIGGNGIELDRSRAGYGRN